VIRVLKIDSGLVGDRLQVLLPADRVEQSDGRGGSMAEMVVMLAIGHLILSLLLVGMVFRLGVAVERIARCQESLLRDERPGDARRPFEVRDTVEISSSGR